MKHYVVGEPNGILTGVTTADQVQTGGCPEQRKSTVSCLCHNSRRPGCGGAQQER